MFYRKLTVLAVGIVLGSLSPVVAATNLIQDGQFSEGAGAGSFRTIATDGSIGAWTVGHDSIPYPTLVSSSVDLIGSLWSGPPTGGYSVDLNGTLGANGASSTVARGSIFQAINVASAGNYTLTFYVSGNEDGLPVDKSFIYQFGSNFQLGSTSDSVRAGEWTKVVETAFLSAGTQYVSFGSYMADATNQFGPVVGDVSVFAAAPEPSTWAMMLLGFAGLGFAGYRSSRKSNEAAT